MNDRDRLAADLRDNALLATVGVRDNEHYWPALADRLIALGWTRLDEERLAQALLATGVLGDAQAASHIYAKNIAKAYREDTDERP